MKKCVLLLILALLLCGCGRKEKDLQILDGPGSVVYYFEAEVLEVNENSLLTVPEEQWPIRASADRVVVPLEDWHLDFDPQPGDIIGVQYDGVVEELYPARVPNLHRVHRITPAGAKPEAQTELLFEEMELWRAEEYSDMEVYFYAVTDLDGNGRLEIFRAITAGTGIFTTGQLFEVSEDYKTVLPCAMPDSEGNLPEVILISVPSFVDGANRRNYIFPDSAKNGAAEYLESVNALILDHGTVTVENIAFHYSLYTPEGLTETFEAAGGIPITAEEYETAAQRFAGDAQMQATAFDWFSFREEVTPERLMASWRCFGHN